MSPVLGPAASMITLGLAGVVLILLVAGINAWTRRQHSRRAMPVDDPGTVESCPAYKRYRAAAASAAGSTRDWDYRVRPVLADLVDAAVTQHNLNGGSTPAGQALLGEQLWALVDRDAPRSEDRSTPSGGSDGLLEIVERVEELQNRE